MKGHIPNAQFVKIMSNYKYDFNKTDLWANPLKISKGAKYQNLLEMSISIPKIINLNQFGHNITIAGI